MSEYISREAAIVRATKGLADDFDAYNVKVNLEAIPAADVVEVRHGRWHRFSKGSGSYNGGIILSDAFQCTVCKESFWNKSNYCPNCGAKMDGGQDDGMDIGV